MKRTTMSVVATLVLAAGTLTTLAATNYWDNNGSAAGFGAAGGTWGTEQKWNSDNTGVAAPGTTTTTTSDDLNFGTSVNGLSAGTITVDGVLQGFGGISFGQASGEITLSGGTLNLAAVSSIRANNASNTIGSVLAGSSALHIAPGDMHYGAFLPATPTLATVFPNARLADYRGADGIMGGVSITGGSRPAQAYFFSNDGSICTYQLQQNLDGQWTKCVKVELTQVGPDIQGRALYAKYINNGNVLGYDFDAGGNVNSIATSYTVGAYGAAETFLTTSANHLLFLTTTPTTVAAGARLADVTGVDGAMGGAWVGGGGARIEGTPFFFSNDGSTATYQLQIIDGQWTKCVKVELTQSGTNIQGRAVYAKYINNGQVLGYDFDSGGNNGTVATSYGANGYGAAETIVFFANGAPTITLTGVNTYSGATRIGGGTLAIGGAGQLGSGTYAQTIINDGQFLYNSSANQALTGAISGTGTVTKGAAAHSYLYHNFFLTSVASTIFTGATLSDYLGADGVMGGAGVFSNKPFPADAYHFSNDGTTATFQLQIYDGGHTKCVKIELTQVGADIQGHVVYAKYLLNQNNLGYDFDTGGNSSGIATSYTAGGYGCAEVTIVTDDNSKLRYQVANTYSGGTVVNAGILETVSSASTLPSSGDITVGSGGHLRCWVGGLVANNAGGVGNGNAITVNGGRLTLAALFNAGYSRLLTINGGLLNIAFLDGSAGNGGDGGNYMNNIVLQSGARVTGKRMRVGYQSSATIAVSGTSASSIESGITLVNSGGQTLTLDVSDATADADADLVISGPMHEFPGYTGLQIIKNGAGTVSLSAVNTYVGLTTVNDGAVALGVANALDADNAIVLDGGALDMGDFNNTLGTLTVNSNSELHLGSGQLTFADSSGVAWSGHLTLVGTLEATTLRFGNDDSDLTVAQLKSISIDGNPVDIDQNGYLMKASNGSLFMFK